MTVNLASSNPSQGTSSATSLTFDATNWNVAQAVTVTGQDDHVVHGDQAYSVSLAALSSDANSNGQLAAVSSIDQERDAAGVTVSPATGLVTSPGTSAQFSVALTSQPTAPVTINVASSNAAQGTPLTTSLTFDATDWNVPRT